MPDTDYSSSSASSSKYDLTDDDGKTVLVYQYRGRLKIESQGDLRETLEKGRQTVIFT